MQGIKEIRNHGEDGKHGVEKVSRIQGAKDSSGMIIVIAPVVLCGESFILNHWF